MIHLIHVYNPHLNYLVVSSSEAALPLTSLSPPSRGLLDKYAPRIWHLHLRPERIQPRCR
jgi:hypothetical protein